MPPSTPDLAQAFNDETLPPIARLDAAQAILRILDKCRANLMEDVMDIVRNNVSDDDTLATMYWAYEDLIPVSALGHYSKIQHIVTSRSPWTHPCSQCGTEIPITSRAQLRDLQSPRSDLTGLPGQPESVGPLCRACGTIRIQTEINNHGRRAEQHRERVQQLKMMPYKDYLLTPEWQQRRKARLQAARFRCQVCNTRDRVLNVHHRTYERRGEEYARDLIVLCEPCHHLFHQNGSLAPHD